MLLGQTTDHSFFSRIEDGLSHGLVTQNERDDLHMIRGFRNTFAHNLRANSCLTRPSRSRWTPWKT